MKRSIDKTVDYPHPRERVWRALTTREALAQWLMPNDFVPQVGHRFEFRTDPAPGFDGIVRCEVLELDPPRRMVWSWRGGSIDTRVTFELEARGEGATRLRFSQTGFVGVGPVLTSFILQAGFAKMYRQKLPAVLERLANDLPLEEETVSKHEHSRVGRLAERFTGRVAQLFDRRPSP